MTWFQKDQEPHRFRERTALHKSCNGVMSPSFRCICCGEPRSASGRKQRIPGDRRSGWVCRECQR